MTNIQKKVAAINDLFNDFSDRFWKKGFWVSVLVVLAGIALAATCLVFFLVDFLASFLTSRLFRILLAVSYFMEQNEYYGWNAKPKSDMELLTDGIWALLVILALWPETKNVNQVTINNKAEE